MLTVNFKLVGASPLGFSAPVASTKERGENHDAFEERTWRERMHMDDDGKVFLVPMSIKNCLVEVCKYLGETIPGKGKATWTKHYEGGLMIPKPLQLGVKAKDVPGLKLFVPSSGIRGGGSRVWKTFPVLQKWSTDVEALLFDRLLIDNTDKFQEFLEHAGQFIGLGFFRPRNNGYYGRFTVENFRAK